MSSNDWVIFFDDRCPFCHNLIRHIIDIDENNRFLFAALRGTTAQEILTGPQEKLKNTNSLVFVEEYRSTHRRFWTHSHALLRAYWLIGKGWSFVGLFSFLPQWIGIKIYNRVASHRHQFFLDIPELPGPSERFLP